jgi:hypothetical protein
MPGTRSLGWGLCVGAALLGGALVSAASACNSDDSSTPTGSGDNVTVDVDATNLPGAPTDAGTDSPFARVEGGYAAAPDGYDPYGLCQKCACPATDYCFGGGTGYTSFSGSCTPSGFGVGCNPLPAGCSGASDCDCLLMATASKFPCYAVCVQNSRTVYCPNP